MSHQCFEFQGHYAHFTWFEIPIARAIRETKPIRHPPMSAKVTTTEIGPDFTVKRDDDPWTCLGCGYPLEEHQSRVVTDLLNREIKVTCVLVPRVNRIYSTVKVT